MGEKLNAKRFFGRLEMTNMQDREKAFESKFALDEELKFKAEARRNKLLGLWAAELLGKSDAAAYAKEVVAADFEEVGHEDVVRKIRTDFDAAGITLTDDEIRLKMLELLSEAVTQIQNN
jgi:hypothetical protein